MKVAFLGKKLTLCENIYFILVALNASHNEFFGTFSLESRNLGIGVPFVYRRIPIRLI